MRTWSRMEIIKNFFCHLKGYAKRNRVKKEEKLRIAYEEIAANVEEDKNYPPLEDLENERQTIRNTIRALKDKMNMPYADSDVSSSDIESNDEVHGELDKEEEKEEKEEEENTPFNKNYDDE